MRTEVIRPREVGLVISSQEKKPYEDIIQKLKLGGLKLNPIAETFRRIRKSPPEKGDVDTVVRSMKENVNETGGPTDHSPGI